MMTTTPDLDVDDYQFPLPGFRFHPTDEELVDYYLRRKVEKKSITMELIKQIDIYKHNPWDLPHVNGTLGEKECYVFVKRGRKYKNSVRPNRVTGSGFWKATGIDKPIYSGHGVHHCIGLKKTLVYYRGSAGRGVKTEWMMHEFRLPPSNHNNAFDTQFGKTKDIVEEAEIWTLCRIFKRSVSCKRYTPNWKEIPATKTRTVHGEMKSSKTISNTMDIAQSYNGERETETNFISFSSPFINFEEKKPLTTDQYNNQRNQLMMMKMKNSNNSITEPAASEFSPSPPLSMNVSPASSGFSSFDDHEALDDLFGSENWDELRSLVEFAFDP